MVSLASSAARLVDSSPGGLVSVVLSGGSSSWATPFGRDLERLWVGFTDAALAGDPSLEAGLLRPARSLRTDLLVAGDQRAGGESCRGENSCWERRVGGGLGWAGGGGLEQAIRASKVSLISTWQLLGRSWERVGLSCRAGEGLWVDLRVLWRRELVESGEKGRTGGEGRAGPGVEKAG